MNETFREPTVDELAMQIEEKGLTAAVAPLRADSRSLGVIAARACASLRAALTDATVSDAMWLRAYVAARVAAPAPMPVAA
ncbi:hypothetical protein [Nocardioides sp.]|uniref:hypothetical protein n=1 Tax=Nocardioides sp. TaxID=35761 RepID=UPI003526DE5A